MRVAVAGAGIAGLTAAIALAERGFSVELFERAAALEEVGAGIQLSPNAMAVLERLGIAAALQPSLVSPEALEIRDGPSGARLATIPLGDAMRRRYGAPYCLVHRADLQAVLLDVAREHPGIELRLHADVHDVRATEGGIVLRAGGRGTIADVLVAADGVGSRVRTDYFGHPGPRAAGRTAWRATLAMEDAPRSLRRDATGLWLGPRAHLVHYPVSGGRHINVVAIAESPAHAPAPPMQAFCPIVRQIVEAVPAWTPWPLFDVDARRSWVRGRVVLVGDAAHAMLPTAAQGGAQAIEDAWVLAEALASKPDDPPAALAGFERARRPRVERIAAEARRNLLIYNLRGFSALARNAFLLALPAKLHLTRLDWIFAWKPGLKNT